MSVLNRGALEDSPLADLHELASELSIDGYRRLRREALIDAILDRQGGDRSTAAPDTAADEDAGERPARRRRPRRGTRAAEQDESADESAPAPAPAPTAEVEEDEDDDEDRPRRRRSRRGGRSRSERRDGADGAESVDPDTPAADAPPAEEPAQREDELVEGVVELLPNGSGFVRVSPPDPSDSDVYISAAQVKRCELVTGDRVSGPRRAPRRSERFASLVRIDNVNGRPASELADGLRFDDLPAALPSERLALGSEDPTLKALEFLAPFGRGSRVTIVGAARAGKTEDIRRLHTILAEQEELQVFLVLAGVRPEEISEAARSDRPPAGAIAFGASADAQGHAVELVIDQARRIAARGAHAVVLIDTLDGMHPPVARRITAAARNIVDGGSLTVVATASAPLGGETTVIALDAELTAQGRFPAIDLVRSGALRPDLLVGEAAAEAIVRARGEALGN